MFVGEMGCWLVVGGMALWRRYISSSSSASYEAVPTADDTDGASIRSHTALNGSGNRKDQNVLRGWRVLLLSLPAVCDILGTTLMNAGLLLVAASIYQMTRGALVLFVGLFSVVFLKRRLHLFQWLSLVGVVTGVAIVGLAGALWPDPKKVAAHGVGAGAAETATATADVSADALRAIAGVMMIAGAQIFTATQFVLEEWILEKSEIEPIVVVGWEGLFGFLVTVLGMVVLHFAVGRTEAGRYGPFDMVEGWRQITHNRVVALTSLAIMVSIGWVVFSLSPLS
jgi:drug/metabolite transporter (DMT)-like permease